MKRHLSHAGDPSSPGDPSGLLEQMEERLLDRLMARLNDAGRKKRRTEDPDKDDLQMEKPSASTHQPDYTPPGTSKTQGPSGAPLSLEPERRRSSLPELSCKRRMYTPTFPVPQQKPHLRSLSRSRSDSEPTVLFAAPITGNPNQEPPKFVNYSWGISVVDSGGRNPNKWREYINDRMGKRPPTTPKVQSNKPPEGLPSLRNPANMRRGHCATRPSMQPPLATIPTREPPSRNQNSSNPTVTGNARIKLTRVLHVEISTVNGYRLPHHLSHTTAVVNPKGDPCSRVNRPSKATLLTGQMSKKEINPQK